MLDVTPDNIMTNISIYEPFVLVDGQYHKLRKDMVYKWLTWDPYEILWENPELLNN